MFKEMLESIIERTEGSLGALIMGTDGIAVEKVLGEAGIEANLDVAAAELPWCRAHDTGVIVYSPMASGLLIGSATNFFHFS